MPFQSPARRHPGPAPEVPTQVTVLSQWSPSNNPYVADCLKVPTPRQTSRGTPWESPKGDELGEKGLGGKATQKGISYLQHFQKVTMKLSNSDSHVQIEPSIGHHNEFRTSHPLRLQSPLVTCGAVSRNLEDENKDDSPQAADQL
ncbi:hypothetical protein MG293_015068 [Ovis ammon polii]|uniref:Uncharacterized protein n=1 Tax=Ovis ammon polii TaxID=230172 RepID=A0AAD4Y4B8_OVIAM|nr:hypothetical protein MG293_015068 [Ovis ammon polii]KAI4558933.1 hypothetical protein MJT46_013575 [Ovis ammon polii x Ovis aries]